MAPYLVAVSCLCPVWYIILMCAQSNEVSQIDFTNADTTCGQSVPITCDTGYKLF